MKIFSRILKNQFIALLACVVVLSSCSTTSISKDHGKVLIPGVPFISWPEAVKLEYIDKSILNPSLAAAFGMVLKYFGKDIRLLNESKTYEKLKPIDFKEPKSIERLKSFLADGQPLIVILSLTPAAHPDYRPIPITVNGISFPEPGPVSGFFGRMLSLETYQDLNENIYKGSFNPINESVSIAARLLIGYDDDRSVFILHDPSFGPAWELSYKDFEVMWRVTGARAFSVTYSSGSRAKAEKHESNRYRSRSPSEIGAAHYVFGYGYSSARKLKKAEQEFKHGLEVVGIDRGLHHLLLLELAYNYTERGRVSEAVELATKAGKLVQTNPKSWELLEMLYRCCGDQLEGEAPGSQKKEQWLADDPKSGKPLAELIPTNLPNQFPDKN